MAVLGEDRSMSDWGVLQKIDQVCVAFEEAWCDGDAPDLPDFLSHFPGTSHDLALRELLWIEWDYLRRSAQPPRLDDYLSRFPESAGVVEEAWEIDRKRLAGGDAAAVPRGNRYRIIKRHARGGLGQVYVANDEEVGRQVALKEIRSGHAQDPGAQERLLREARITGRLEHPGIVPVFSLGKNADGTPYYTMRFVQGDSLREAIGEFHAEYGSASPASTDSPPTGAGTPLSGSNPSRPAAARKTTAGRVGKPQLPAEAYRSVKFRRLLARFAYVCHVAEYAHQHGVIHRDLKPSNIMLGKHDETLVVDWGLAKEMGVSDADDYDGNTALLEASSRSDFTTHGATLGTPAYMSPEQAAGDPAAVGPASDIFSLGATLFHLLTGTSPFGEEQTTAALRRRGRADAAPRARKRQPAVPPPLDAICAKTLAFQAEDRYGSAELLARDIENWLADEAVTAYVEPMSSRLGRWARRHRTLVRSSIVAFVLLCLSLAATAVLTAIHNRDLAAARQDAEAKRIVAEDERDASQSISALIVDWLSSPDPDLDGRLVTVAEILDRAFERVRSDERIAAKTKFVLLETLENSYSGLGLYGRAMEVTEYTMGLREFGALDAERRLRVRLQFATARLCNGEIQRALAESEDLARETQSVLGPENDVSLSAKSLLAASYTMNGRPRDGLRTAEEAFEVSRRKLGETHQKTIALASEKARALAELERFDEAVAIAEKELDWSRAEFGADHSTTLRSQNQLGVHYRRAGKYDRAIALYKETLAARLQRFGPDHPYTLNTQDLLARAYAGAGNYEDAIALHQETLGKRKSQQGHNSRNTLRSTCGLGAAYANAGRNEEAIVLLQEAFDAQRQLFGEADRDTLRTQRHLALALVSSGHLQQGIPLLEQAVQQSSEKFGDELAEVNVAKVDLAVAYRKVGRMDDAIRIYEELLPSRMSVLGPTHPEVMTLKVNLAAALAAAGQLEEAVTLLDETLPVAREQLGAKHPVFWAGQLNLAFSLRSLNQVDRMVNLLEIPEPRIEQELGWHHSSTLAWYVGLAAAYTDLQRYDDATATYRSLIEQLERHVGKDAAQTWAAKRFFAGFLASSAGQIEEAIFILQEAVKVLGQKYGTDNAQTMGAMQELAAALRLAERYPEAEEAYERLVALNTRAEQPDLPNQSGYLSGLGICQVKQQKFDKAESTFRDCWHIRQQIAPSDWKTANAESMFGEALTGAGKYEEAEQHLVPAFATLEAAAQRIPVAIREKTLCEAAQRVVELYDALGQVELAEQWRRRLASLEAAGDVPADTSPKAETNPSR